MNSLKVALVVSAVCFFAARSVAGTYYVDYENGSDSSDGTAEGVGAWKTLAHAVATAEAESEIVLAAGTHPIAANVVVEKALTIRGAGAPEETQIDGGMMNVSVSLKMAGATLRDLTLQNTKGDWNPALTTIAGTIVSNVILTALSNDWHEDFKLDGGLLSGCRIVGNSNPNGTLFKFSSVTMENCLVMSNTASSVFNFVSASAVVRNTTIVNNTATGSSAVLNMSYKTYIQNCIIWGNVNDAGTANWSGAANAENWIRNCTTPVDGLPAAGGNIGDDPAFFSDGYHIKSSSPCNHTANPDYATTVDLEGQLRGDEPSIGAFEYADIGELEVSISPSATFVHAPDTITLTPIVVGVSEEDVHYSWDLKGDGTVLSDERQPVLSAVGSYLPKLTVTIDSREPTVVTLGVPLVIHSSGTQPFYVDSVSGDDARDGMTPQTAWRTLSFALASQMVESGDEIVLGTGLHPLVGNLEVGKAVTIRGAGAAEETQIDGGKGNVSVSLSVAGATLRDVTLQNMVGTDNPSLITAAGTVVSNVVLTGLSNDWREGFRFSGGLITGCRFVKNNNPNGSLFKFSAGTMENCLVMSNTVGSVFQLWGWPVIRNSTIVDNTCTSGTGYALNMTYEVDVQNCIVWGNVNTLGTANWSGAAKATKWIGNCTTPVDGLPAAGGNIGDDPAFFSDGYHIKSTSPCNHTANPAYATTVDIDGFPRGDEPSIGAFEYVDIGELEVSISPSATFVSLPETITLTPVIVGAPAGEISYSWDLKSDGTMLSMDEKPVLSVAGIYRPTLTVRIDSGEPTVVTLGSPLVVHPAGAQTYYVDNATGDNARDGMTPQTAWQTLAYAVGSPLVVTGDAIRLLTGMHPVPAGFSVAKAIVIAGEGPEATQLDGNTSGTLALEVAGAKLQNLTMQRFGGDSGLKTVTGALVSNVVFTAVSDAYQKAVDVSGGGFVTGCRFVANNHPHAELIKLNAGAVLENCLIEGNACGDSVGVYGHDVTVRNCTIANNNSSGSGVGVFMKAYGKVSNTIVRGNTNASGPADWAQWNDWTLNWSHNCTSSVEDLPDSFNFDKDPLFSSRYAYHLTAASPCRNAGSDALAATGVDLDGNPRKIGRHVDLGCFEFGGTGMSVLVR